MEGGPTPADISAAAQRIAGLVIHTPIIESPALGEVVIKVETLQPTGSFKIRGAASKILSLDADERARGVVTASTGNHGRAVAHVAARLGIPATVCVSESVPLGKIAALASTGCALVVGGNSQTDALVTALRLVDERGLSLVHPFDDPAVIAGQGTIGRELTSQLPGVRSVVVPLSGGGLAAGVGIAVKGFDPTIRVIGVSMVRGAVMATSVQQGAPVEMDERPTLADSLQGGIGLDNRYTFGIVARLVDEIVLVDEPEIWAGMRFALEHHRLIVEGGAAVGLGALASGRIRADGPTAVIATGSNIEPHHLVELAEELAAPVRRATRDRPD